jgi:hypothetical protein
MKPAVFWDVAPCSFALMMEAARTAETPISLPQTISRNIAEDSHLQEKLVLF